jgi:GNAT superfamily N-acetyltransferase
VFIQFTLNPDLAERSKGNSIWITVKNIERLLESHREKKAEIVMDLKYQPWGFLEYVVREINGYYLRFSARASEGREKSTALPPTIRIVSRKPTIKEYQNLATAVGFTHTRDDAGDELRLAAPITAVVAENIETSEVVGCALLLGDNISFYYVKDVMVDPAWQGKNVGTALMRALTNWIDQNAPPNAFVTLITPEPLAAFYKQFDFVPVFGMARIKENS